MAPGPIFFEIWTTENYSAGSPPLCRQMPKNRPTELNSPGGTFAQRDRQIHSSEGLAGGAPLVVKRERIDANELAGFVDAECPLLAGRRVAQEARSDPRMNLTGEIPPSHTDRS